MRQTIMQKNLCRALTMMHQGHIWELQLTTPELIRIHRLKHQPAIAQQALANALQLDRTMVSRFENGDCVPDFYQMCAIANRLDVSLDHLRPCILRVEKYL